MHERRRTLCLTVVRERLEARVRVLDDGVIRSADDLIVALGRAAVHSPPARDTAGVLVVRTGTNPGLAVVGELGDAEVARVEALFAYVEELLGPFRYVSYPRAERDVQALARELLHRFGRSQLERATFEAIPRGGLIVLGMLSLELGLRHEQLTAGVPDEGLHVVVDDCGLSGRRLCRWLQQCTAPRVAAAYLYAPLELCERVERVEPRVEACVTAQVLEDRGPERMGAGYSAWVQERQEELGRDRYWIGRPEPVVFAWKEPDRSFLNSATGEREADWRLLPQRLGSANPGVGSLQLQLQAPAPGPLGPGEDVFVARAGASTVLARAGDDDAVELDLVASDMWDAVTERGTVEGATEALRARYEVERSVLERDLQVFVTGMVGEGFLVEAGTAAE